MNNCRTLLNIRPVSILRCDNDSQNWSVVSFTGTLVNKECIYSLHMIRLQEVIVLTFGSSHILCIFPDVFILTKQVVTSTFETIYKC